MSESKNVSQDSESVRIELRNNTSKYSQEAWEGIREAEDALRQFGFDVIPAEPKRPLTEAEKKARDLAQREELEKAMNARKLERQKSLKEDVFSQDKLNFKDIIFDYNDKEWSGYYTGTGFSVKFSGKSSGDKRSMTIGEMLENYSNMGYPAEIIDNGISRSPLSFDYNQEVNHVRFKLRDSKTDFHNHEIHFNITRNGKPEYVVFNNKASFLGHHFQKEIIGELVKGNVGEYQKLFDIGKNISKERTLADILKYEMKRLPSSKMELMNLNRLVSGFAHLTSMGKEDRFEVRFADSGKHKIIPLEEKVFQGKEKEAFRALIDQQCASLPARINPQLHFGKLTARKNIANGLSNIKFPNRDIYRMLKTELDNNPNLSTLIETETKKRICMQLPDKMRIQGESIHVQLSENKNVIIFDKGQLSEVGAQFVKHGHADMFKTQMKSLQNIIDKPVLTIGR